MHFCNCHKELSKALRTQLVSYIKSSFTRTKLNANRLVKSSPGTIPHSSVQKLLQNDGTELWALAYDLPNPTFVNSFIWLNNQPFHGKRERGEWEEIEILCHKV